MVNDLRERSEGYANEARYSFEPLYVINKRLNETIECTMKYADVLGNFRWTLLISYNTRLDERLNEK